MVVLWLAVTGVGRAAEAPAERLLPAETQIYFRWDGIDAHRAAYAQTAAGKMMQGDTGKFFTGVLHQLRDNLGPMLTVPQLLGGAGPAQLQKIQALASQAPRVIEVVGQHGLVVGIELRGKEQPEFQAVIVVPGSGKDAKPLFSLLQLLALTGKAKITEGQIDGRQVSHLDLTPIHLAWWVDGDDTVLSIGTGSPEAQVKRTAGNGPRLRDNALFQRVHGFKDFETAARAYVDVAALAKAARARGKDYGHIIDELGLDNLQSMQLYSGFDGLVERSIVEWQLAGGERKGLFRLTGGRPFRLEDLPPAPDDLVSLSAMNLDLAAAYDVSVPVIETLVSIFNPGEKAKVREGFRMVDQALGIDVRKDLLGELGPRFVHYSSPSDGALNFGEVFLFQVKDGAKVKLTLEQAIKGLASATGANLRVKRHKYHGIDVHEVLFKQQGFFFLPTYAIHDGWLIMSYYPQPVHGYLLRATKELPAWQPPQSVRQSLDKLPKEFIAFSVSDPRPTIRQILTIAPAVVALINSLVPDFQVDVGAMPNAAEATQHLFPNVSVVTDNGNVLRSETRASVSLPFELTGLDSYGIFFLFGAVIPLIAG
jgi:hypothetical protein